MLSIDMRRSCNAQAISFAITFDRLSLLLLIQFLNKQLLQLSPMSMSFEHEKSNGIAYSVSLTLMTV